jgi:hypothetical protein
MKLFDDATRRCEERLVMLSREVQRTNVKIETLQRDGRLYLLKHDLDASRWLLVRRW